MRCRASTTVITGSTAYPKWGLSWTYDRYGVRRRADLILLCFQKRLAQV